MVDGGSTVSETVALRGVYPVLAVPFTEDGEVDLEGFRSVVRYVDGTGAPGAALFGLASEYAKLTDAERADLLEVFLAESGGTRIVTVTDHSSHVAIRRAVRAVEAGADGITLLVSPLLGATEQAISHVEEVLKAVRGVPVILQQVAGQSPIPVARLEELRAAHADLRYVKVETAPAGRRIVALRSIGIASLIGMAGVQLPDALRRGAVGVQPGSSFVELYVELWDRWETGEVAAMEGLYRQMLPYLVYWMQSQDLIVQAEKTILARRGIVGTDVCRPPGRRLDREEIEMLEGFLEEFGERIGV